MTVRAIVGARVSHVQGQEKMSHVDQNHSCTQYAERQGWEIVGSFEDLDVSAIKTTPWQRPDLGPWLRERPGEWDALIFAKTDRVFRSAKDSVDLAHWCEENKKIFVLVEDGISLDYFHPRDDQDTFSEMMSRIFLLMSSMFAEIEGRRFMQRAQSRVRSFKHTDRFAYGIAPYGFQIVPHPSGKGKALDHDPASYKVLREHIAAPLLTGAYLNTIANQLNDDGILTPRDHELFKKGMVTKGHRWTSSNVRKLLLNPATQGIKVGRNQRPILDTEGHEIRLGPPVFTPAEWSQIQSELESRSSGPRPKRHSTNPLLGVAKCGVCGSNLRQRTQTTKSGKEYRYYVCNKPRPCPKISVRSRMAEEMMGTQFLDECGHRYVQERVYQMGENHAYELEDVNKTIENLREDRALGLYNSPEDQETYRNQMQSLTKRRDELSSRPVKKAGWTTVPTDKTYEEVWASSTEEQKREMLIAAGAVMTVNGPTDINIYIDLEQVQLNYGA